MNLREQIEQEITDKVMTKLASERVELSFDAKIKALEKDIKNYANEINSTVEKSDSQGRKIEELIKSYKVIKEELKNLQKQLEKVTEDIAKRKNEISKEAESGNDKARILDSANSKLQNSLEQVSRIENEYKKALSELGLKPNGKTPIERELKELLSYSVLINDTSGAVNFIKDIASDAKKAISK